ncbi:Ataxin-3 [Mortierella alpina]|uniref:Ataxin-3 homolog n=1 Tax=Mortierella alpina TaxID=64518 RepID=A0A9P6J7I5_MORAP|nr:Ataxin-3 [Mortierella alpina]
MDLVPYIFHEQQEGNLCAQHCLNALLQGPYFTAIDLAELARQLDQKEQDALGNFGSGSGDIKSQNMDDSGFFSVQVLSHALSIWNIQIIPWGAEEVSDAKAEPEREAAFICNLEQHWYTLRRFGPSTQRWYDLNSLHPRPQHMSATYLGMTLSQLETEGYSIFVVRPLVKDDNVSAASTEMSPAAIERTPSLPIKSAEPAATSATPLPATAVGFLSERQEMERIRRQRLEERERASQQSTCSSSQTPTTAAIDTSITQKRTRVEPTEGGTGKETRRPSTSVLVTTPSFLPRCEVDEMAATMPLQNVPSTLQEQSNGHTPAFGGTGHRLGGSQSTAVVDSFDGVIQGLDGDNDHDEDDDLEAQMMQQAIAMSLQGSQK